MVMLDYETGSYWWQVAGEAIVGALTGETLTVLPSMLTTWQQWKELHPGTVVLSRDTGYPARGYDRDPFVGYEEVLNEGRFAFPVSEAAQDGRLPAGAHVLVVKVGDDVRGYPLTGADSAVLPDVVGDQQVVVFLDADGVTGAVYEPVASGQSLTFELRDGGIVDRETKSAWNLAGRAVQGPLKDTLLPAIPSMVTFWFAVVAAEPGITLFQADTG